MPTLSNSIRYISFHDSFYCIGYDIDKLKNGIEDLTKLKDLEPHKCWNDGIVACKKIPYKNKSKRQIIAKNKEYWQFNVVK